VNRGDPVEHKSSESEVSAAEVYNVLIFFIFAIVIITIYCITAKKKGK